MPKCWSQTFLAKGLLICLLTVPGAVYAQRTKPPARDSFVVYFALDEDALSTPAKSFLDSLGYRAALHRGQDYYLIGYADYVGSSGYNDSLSLRRAQAVQHHLLTLGLRAENMRSVAGRGEISRPGRTARTGYAPDRKVVIARARGGFDRPQPEKVKPVKPRRSRLTIDSLAAVPVNEVVVLRNMYFPVGRHVLYRESYPELDALAAALEENPTMRVRVEGHVCCIDPRVADDALDDDTGERNLSFARAKYIVDYLVRSGVEPERLEYSGFGKSRPVVVPELSDADAVQNRRVEVRVLSR